MVNLSWATQVAIQTLLANNAVIITLTAQGDGKAGVWNFEPATTATLPYITFQEVSSVCADTFGREGKNMTWDINVWSGQPGEAETSTIFDQITTIMAMSWGNTTPLSYDGVNFVLVHETQGPRPIPDPEKGIRRMTATYRIIAQEAA